MRVLVTHPGRQHSHQAALALEQARMLAGYWSGVPATVEQARRVPRALRRHFARYAPIAIAPDRARWFPLAPSLRRVGDALLPHGGAARLDLLACRLFDRWAAAGLRQAGADADAVIACEISALSTFRAARRLGIATILDAPSLHHGAQDALHGTTDPPGLHRRILAVKDREIELADHILTVSSLARDTYLAAGAPAGKVHALMLGADLDLFTPTGTPERDDGSFVFLFCGATIRRKGFDLLLDAFERIAGEAPAARLRVVGPSGGAAGVPIPGPSRAGGGGGGNGGGGGVRGDGVGDRGDSGDRGDRGESGDRGDRGGGGGGARIDVSGPVGQPELAAELRRADCLVLPSRNDSFGMVVPEALACGLPVLVSDMVGARELVAPGRNGWIVPAGDAAALAERMAWCVRHRDTVRTMRETCRASAAAAAWPSYHRRLVQLLGTIVPARAAA